MMLRARIHDERVVERHPGAGDRRGARAAVGLQHVAVDGDLPLAERLQVDDGAQRAADQALDLQRAPALVPERRLAAHALVRGARQHAVFGGDPALAAAAQPAGTWSARLAVHMHVRVAEADQAGALGVLGDAAVEGDRAQFVG